MYQPCRDGGHSGSHPSGHQRLPGRCPGQEPGRLGGWPGNHPPVSDRPAQVRLVSPGWRKQTGVVLDDGSHHAATADRGTSGYDERAGHQYCAPGALAAPASKSSGERAAAVGRDS